MDEREEKMLREYEVGLKVARDIENPIWQTQALLGVVSITTLIYFISQGHRLPIILVMGIGIFVNFLSFIWFKMACRWWSVQHTVLERLLHIEQEIGEIYIQQYIKHRDWLAKPKDKNSKSQNIPDKWKHDVEKLNGHQNEGTKHWSNVLLLVILITWVLFVIFLFIIGDAKFEFYEKISFFIAMIFAVIGLVLYIRELVDC
jgi:polyferredoxin